MFAILPALFLVLAAPPVPATQDPEASRPALAERLAELGIAKELDAALAAGAAAPRPGAEQARTPGFDPLVFLADMRRAGPVVDPLLASLDVPDAGTFDGAQVDRWLETLTTAANAGRQRTRPVKLGGDLRRYEDLLEEVHRDLRGLLGHGVELYEVLPQFHALIDSHPLAPLSSGGKTQADVIERLSQVERAQVIALGRRVLTATLALTEDRVLLTRLAKERGRDSSAQYVRGEILLDTETGFGRMVVGGAGPNTYDCSQIDVIIDLGGDDRYEGPAGATEARRRLGVVCDIAGNDTYIGGNDSLGSATFGIGILVDVAGDDTYEGGDRSGGFGAAGFGAWVDLVGNDKLVLKAYGGGAGVMGCGLCWDGAGDDERTAASHAYGFGTMSGVGLLVDGSGADATTLTGIETDDEVRGVAVLGMGLGCGGGWHRRGADVAGGVGVVIDGGGNDRYVGHGQAMGAGAHTGMGVLLDRGGDDRYDGGTVSVGAAHSDGIGALIDAAGDDHFSVSGMGIGAAVSHGQGWCVDLRGADHYRLMGLGLGDVLSSGVAGFLDAAGEDDYLREMGAERPWAARGDAPEPASGHRGVGLFLDEGGAKDIYRWSGPRPGQDGEDQRFEVGSHILRVDR